jgi:hypothetical protein
LESDSAAFIVVQVLFSDHSNTYIEERRYHYIIMSARGSQVPNNISAVVTLVISNYTCR